MRENERKTKGKRTIRIINGRKIINGGARKDLVAGVRLKACVFIGLAVHALIYILLNLNLIHLIYTEEPAEEAAYHL
jgi:hypothetical protein